MRVRVGAIITRGSELLLMRRFRSGRHYFTFPGGGVEVGEDLESALIREVREELSLEAVPDRKLFELERDGGRQVFYLISRFSGTVALGGEEKEGMSDTNQYHPEWKGFEEIARLPLLPFEARDAVLQLRQDKNI